MSINKIYVIEFRTRIFGCDEWHLSGNEGTDFVFNTKKEAKEAADAQTDGFKYRVVKFNRDKKENK